VAIKFLDLVIFVDYSTANGVIAITNTGDLNAAHITTTVYNSQKYEFTLPTLVIVMVQTLPWPAMNTYFLNLKVTLPSSYKTFMYGLAGYYDGNPANDKTMPDNTLAPNTAAGTATFVQSWSVPDPLNLFDHPTAIIPSFLNGGSGSPSSLVCKAAPTACLPSIDADGKWPLSQFNKVVIGQCLDGFVGTPSKLCNPNGQLGPVMNPCTVNTTTCLGENYGNANWLTTYVNNMAFGSCNPGYSGNPSRFCNANGQWATSISNLCTRIFCPAISDIGNAQFASTASNQTVYGTCLSGFSSVNRPIRFCNISGVWDSTVKNPCS
jgi:hypothetical protein